MKKIVSFSIVILIIISLSACQSKYDFDQINPQNDIYYQIFVRSFADSDEDGIGDLNGITENLDYLQDLGITALWLLPINPSPSYHGYDVTDYYDVNSDYGTLGDLETLIDQANQRDIKIVLDLVINHTSDQHPWYKNATSSTSSEYRDYYVFNNGSAYESFPGGMKDLNLENQEVIDEIYDIVDFYLDMGVHGFRLDAAMHFIEGISSDWKNTLLINNLNLHMQEKNPDSYLVSEVYVNSYDLVKDYYIGSDSLFNFYGQSNILDKIGSGNSRYLFASNFEKAYEAFREVDADFIDAPFIGNHDMDRIASSLGFIDQPDKLKLAANVLLTLPGNPFIYYGDELGMKGTRYEGKDFEGYGIVYDEYRRQPFIWGEQTYQTSWLPSDESNDDTLSLLEQEEMSDSLFNAYKKMIQIRKDNPALMYGNYFKSYASNQGSLQGYVRYYNHENYEQAVLVIHNLSNTEVTIEVDFLNYILGESLTISGYQTIILDIDPDEIGAYI